MHHRPTTPWREWKYLPKAEGEGSLAKLTDYRAVRTTVQNGSYLDPPGVGKLKVGVIVARRLAAVLWLQCHETHNDSDRSTLHAA